jgi:hypothetical protein
MIERVTEQEEQRDEDDGGDVERTKDQHAGDNDENGNE